MSETSQTQMGGEAATNPMSMGMAMARKMMAGMGHGSSPMEMMQKMMSQMSQTRG